MMIPRINVARRSMSRGMRQMGVVAGLSCRGVASGIPVFRLTTHAMHMQAGDTIAIANGTLASIGSFGSMCSVSRRVSLSMAAAVSDDSTDSIGGGRFSTDGRRATMTS